MRALLRVSDYIRDGVGHAGYQPFRPGLALQVCSEASWAVLIHASYIILEIKSEGLNKVRSIETPS
jgi:hypothetical protein